MKKLTLSLISTIIFFALVPQAYAAGGINDLEVQDVIVGGYTDNGRPATRISVSAHSNPSECSRDDIIVIVSSQIGVENVQTIVYEQQYAAALTALVNGSKLDAYTTGCTLDGRFALVSRITVNK